MGFTNPDMVALERIIVEAREEPLVERTRRLLKYGPGEFSLITHQ